MGLLQSPHFLYQKVSPASGVPPQSDCAQRRIEPADLRATHPSPPTPIPYAGDSFCSPIFGGLTSSRNGLLGTVL
jgi:hypothetical protein